MLGNDVLDRNVALCSGRRKHKCAGFDLIRNDGVVRSVKTADTLNSDDVRAGAFDPCAHAVEEVGQVDHVRLFRGILNGCAAFRHDGCHDDIDGSAYGDDVHINMRACQPLCPGVHAA